MELLLLSENNDTTGKIISFIGDDFLQFSIANTKNIAEVLDSLPICLFNDLNRFSGHFCPQSLPNISRG